MKELVDALRRAVQAEIAATIAETKEDSEGHRISTWAERKESERRWAAVVAAAQRIVKEGQEA